LAIVSIGLFFISARRWYGRISGLWLTVLFATSSWLLQTGRFGSGASSLGCMVLALLAIVVWIRHGNPSGWWLVGLATVVSISVLTPGGIWFAAAAVVAAYPYLGEHREQANPTQLTVAAAVLSVALLAVVASIIRHPHLLWQWAGLPSSLPSMATIGKQAVGSISYLVARGPDWPQVWLAHTPILDVASTVLLALGAWFYAMHFDNPRTRLLVSFAAIGMVLVALNGAPALSFLVPVAYLGIGGGVAYLLHQWQLVFPRNPIARGVSIGLLALLLGCVVVYHTQRTFVAWRHNTDTIQAYRSDLPEQKPPNLLQ
jgi:hypothetical protein